VRKTELLKQEEDLKIQLAKLEESLLEVCTYILLPYSFVVDATAAAAAVLVRDAFAVFTVIVSTIIM